MWYRVAQKSNTTYRWQTTDGGDALVIESNITKDGFKAQPAIFILFKIEGLGKEGDIIFVISTSGQSKNILKVLEVANQLKLVTVGLLGTSKSDATSKCRFSLNIESSSTARIQETHILLGHIICDEVEKRLKLK